VYLAIPPPQIGVPVAYLQKDLSNLTCQFAINHQYMGVLSRRRYGFGAAL